MAARPCPVVLNGCPGVDAPVTNVSAEAPDPLLFAGIVWDNYDPHAPPPLGDGPHVRTDCASLQSTIASYDPIIYATTQLMANLQALAISLGCDWPPSGDQTFTNDEQTATVYCPDGTSFTYTVAAGTVVSPLLDPELGAAFVAWANAWASAYAYQQASALMDCFVPSDDTPPDPGPRKPTIPTGAGILAGPVWMCLGEELFHRYTVSGRGASSYDITISDGALPTGTTFVQDGARTGYITGTPSIPGEYNFTIQAVSTTAPTLTITVQDYIFVMGIVNSSSLPDGVVGVAYSETLAATGGTAPYTFTTTDTLPDGLTLASNGTLSGSPTTAGDYSFNVTLTDANGGECIETFTISIVAVDECAGVPATIGDLTWTITAFGPGSYTASMAGGSGAFTYTAPDETPVLHNIFFDSQFCNNTDASITLRVQFNYASTGNVHFPPNPLGSTALLVNGVAGTSSGYCDFFTDTPNPAWAQNTVPAHTTVALQILLFTNVQSATPGFGWHSTSAIALTII